MPLSVIGAGLSRTGTSSLRLALEELGFGPCFHHVVSPAAQRLWHRVRNHQPFDWDEVLNGYRATADLPLCLFYRELAEKYPDAKVVLTLRDPNAWFDSTQSTILSPVFVSSRLAPGTLVEGVPPSLQAYFLDVLSTAFGAQLHDRDSVIEAYERHNAEVQRSIPAGRLIVYDVKQGWEPLCEFLCVPIPDKPFPNINSRMELSAKMGLTA